MFSELAECANSWNWRIGGGILKTRLRKEHMADDHARKILELHSGAPDLDERLAALMAADGGFARRILAAAAMPGLGRRAGVEEADLLPLFGLRFVQQVVAGLLLEDAGVDATNTAILGAIAAQAVAARVPLPKSEEAFLAAWLAATPAWRQAPPAWGPHPDLLIALDKHANLQAEAPLTGARADLLGQCVCLGQLLAGFASPYPEANALDAVQRAARLGIAPRDLHAICADVAKHAEDWSQYLHRPLNGQLRLNLDAPGYESAVRFANELAVMYRYLLQNAAIDAETGLPNARYFRTRLESEWAAARRRGSALSVVAVLCGGDMTRAAHLLRETARMQDVVCRAGDAEFMMICIDTHAEYAAKAAARLSKGMGEQGVAAHFGAATLDSMISSVDDLIDRAQGAARAARSEGAGYKVWQEA